MKMKKYPIYLTLMILFLSVHLLAQEMTKEQWQNQMNQTTARRNELKAKLDKLNADINNLKNQSSKLDADIAAYEEEFFKLTGMSRDQMESFDRELKGYEDRTDELMRMSDADLMKYRDEINKMSKRVDELMKDKVAKLPRFSDRLSNLRKNIDALLNTLAKAEMANVNMYVVGTWAKDRDCLWNIAKKPNIYNNAWLWPKIWQGNKEKIRDPDIIQPGWKLNVPPSNELTKEEKTAANSYYRKKAGK